MILTYNESNSSRDDFQKLINPEEKEGNSENICETKERVTSLGDVPKNYFAFFQDIKEELKGKLRKYEIPDDNEYLIRNNNDEFVIKNTDFNDSSLFLDFNTDSQNKNQQKDNNI